MNVKDSGKSSLQGRYRPACWTTPLRIPGLLARLSSDEYRAPAYSGRDYQALDVLQRAATETARRLGQTLAAYYSSRLGTAASLHAINAAAGTPFYRVDAATTIDREQANECFQGRDLVIDVQTHFVANHRTGLAGAKGVHHFIRQVAPELFSGLNLDTDLSLGEYLRCIFLQSETCLAVLTSAPGTEETNILSNAEIAGTRELVDRLAGTGRLLHHAIVHPNLPGELETLRKNLPTNVRLIAGGRAAEGYDPTLDQCGFVRNKNLSEFYAVLEDLRKSA